MILWIEAVCLVSIFHIAAGRIDEAARKFSYHMCSFGTLVFSWDVPNRELAHWLHTIRLFSTLFRAKANTK